MRNKDTSMFKSLLTSLLIVMAFAFAAFASDSSGTHSALPQDHMLSPWNN